MADNTLKEITTFGDAIAYFNASGADLEFHPDIVRVAISTPGMTKGSVTFVGENATVIGLANDMRTRIDDFNTQLNTALEQAGVSR